MAMINVDIISKVVRRYAYKGGLATHEALPVDATTVMGILLVMGSLLAAPGLPQKTLDQCVVLLASMEEKSNSNSNSNYLVLVVAVVVIAIVVV